MAQVDGLTVLPRIPGVGLGQSPLLNVSQVGDPLAPDRRRPPVSLYRRQMLGRLEAGNLHTMLHRRLLDTV
jgi:hypothetical protein